MTTEGPPAFQEAARCDVCNCTFTTFRRRHHCRRCGRTLCHEHSSNYMALPQFGIFSNVRVCYDCFNNSSRSGNDSNTAYSDGIVAPTDAFSRLEVGDNVSTKDKSTPGDHILSSPECMCGMPLCICKAPIPATAPLQMQSSAISTTQSNPRPKKATTTQQRPESVSKKPTSSTSKPSSFFNLGQASDGNLGKTLTDYDVSGEGLREAIKKGDANAVKKLLDEGVNSNYCDKQGLTLLHLAALFNQTEIAFILMDHGANLECKNAQGETPLDCAPTMLQYKMRKKLEGRSDHHEMSN